MRVVRIGLALVWLSVGMCGASARGDEGTIRVSRCEGAYRITVFTAPAPFRAGPVDVSTLIQDAVTGKPISDAQVTVMLTPRDQNGRPIHHAATSNAATNKLLKAAVFELPEPGRWEVEVTIERGQEVARVRFELDAAERTPSWPAIWSWVVWPVPVIMLFAIHQFLIWRKSHQPASAHGS